MGLDINIVIGANYGDEGKGLVTNDLTKGKDTLVVLTNGGPQRGHTVLYDGTRHIFHHFGSGTLKGAASYFAEEFMVNPAVFVKESAELGYFPKSFASEYCRMTTVFDMIGNSLRNLGRASTDSTGYGILETIERYEDTKKHFMYLGEFLKVSKEKKKAELNNIRVYYLEKFYPLLKDASKFNHKQIRETYELLYDEDLIGAFLEDTEIFAKRVKISPIDKAAKQFSQVIFEQGQGLGIDKEADKTYGTPTRTGSTIPTKYLILFNKLNMIDSVNRYYVTRSYITRHGDGELPDEDTAYEFKHGVKDKTNIHNIYQGSIRFAPFTANSIADLAARINKDIKGNNTPNINIKDNLVMTHYTNKSIYVLKSINNLIISPSCEVYISTQEDKKFEKVEKINPLYTK